VAQDDESIDSVDISIAVYVSSFSHAVSVDREAGDTPKHLKGIDRVHITVAVHVTEFDLWCRSRARRFFAHAKDGRLNGLLKRAVSVLIHIQAISVVAVHSERPTRGG
jgi:hypothetical protein